MKHKKNPQPRLIKGLGGIGVNSKYFTTLRETPASQKEILFLNMDDSTIPSVEPCCFLNVKGKNKNEEDI